MSTPTGLVDFAARYPALPQDQLVFSTVSFNLAAGGSQSFPAFTVARPSYVMGATVVYPAATVLPYTRLRCFWMDPSGTPLLANENYLMAGGTGASNCSYFGRGPTKSAFANLDIENFDATNAATVTVYFYQSYRNVNRDDFRARAFSGVSGANVVSNNVPALHTIAMVGNTIAAGVTTAYVVPPYAGEQNIQFNTSVAGWGYSLQSISPDLSATPANWPFLLPPATNEALAGAGPFTIFTPRRPLLLSLTAPAAGPCTFGVTMIPLEIAS